ncbi:MAG: VWA domain-containing protein [Acidobacteriota bacterium]
MKNLFVRGFLFLCSWVFLNPAFFLPTNPSFPQEEHVERVVSIEVPVRVYKKGRFVRDLSIQDFMLLEDGKPQRIDAVYLIKKKTIEREEKHEEAVKTREPEIASRNFVLVFETRHYLPKLDQVLDYFFNKVMLPGDTLKVYTPVRAYTIKEEAFKVLPKQKIADQLKAKLRKDIVRGASDYRAFYEQIRTIVYTEGFENLKNRMCMDILRRMKALQQVNASKLIELAENLKQTEGQKHMFLFFQKQSLPILESLEVGDRLELLGGIPNHVEEIKRAFSDASISGHFVFITKKPSDELDITRMFNYADQEIKMEDSSGEIFGAFNDLAKATGGLTESSANVAVAFQKTVEATENYYLVYYTPKDYKADNKFHKIEIRIRGGGYRITHRAGYMAD